MTVHFAARPGGADDRPIPSKGRPDRVVADSGRGSRTERRSGPSTSCRDPKARSLLVPYVMSTVREDEAVAFESHLLACGSCFRDLKCLDRAGALIREFTRAGSVVIEGAESTRGRGQRAERKV